MCNSKELTERDEEWKKLKKSNLSYAVYSLMIFFVLAGALSVFYENEIRTSTQWIANVFGLKGMCAVVFIADSIISPIPPDTMLLVVAKSQLKESWFLYVSLFSLCSVLGGNTGYLIGYIIRQSPWMPRWVLTYASKNQSIVEKFGHWVVVLGALTPLPFSITCWGAGIVRLSWDKFFIASLFRIPRIFAAYFLLVNSEILTNFLSNNLFN